MKCMKFLGTKTKKDEKMVLKEIKTTAIVIFGTASGSSYEVNLADKTLRGGKHFDTPVQFTNNPIFMKGMSSHFDLADGRTVDTNIVISVRTSTFTNKEDDFNKNVNEQNQEVSGYTWR